MCGDPCDQVAQSEEKQMSVMKWPERVWEPTGVDRDGRTLWSSRPVEKEDKERRKRVEVLLGLRKADD